MRNLCLLSLLAVVLFLFSSGKVMVNAQKELCNFRPYHMQCSEEECSKFCKANYGEKAPSHCMNSITCCCEGEGEKVAADETQTCNFTPYRMPKCTSEECNRLCTAYFSPNTPNECVDFETCCCHAVPH